MRRRNITGKVMIHSSRTTHRPEAETLHISDDAGSFENYRKVYTHKNLLVRSEGSGIPNGPRQELLV